LEVSATMNESFTQAQDFLNQIFEAARLDMRADVSESESGCTMNIDGADSPLLRSEGGELLDALEHLVNQAFARKFPEGARVVCDVDSFRAVREAELRAMARHAADRVKTSGVPFTFGPMTAGERRIIHLSLADDAQLFTESVGEGAARRLKVSLKK
jgi:spoIIIJ-associated protein